MTVEELARKYDIKPSGRGTLLIYRPPKDNKVIEEIKAKKVELLAYFDEQQEKRRNEERAWNAKIDAIPGLNELKNAIDDVVRFRREFDEMMDDEYNDGVFPPRRPTADIAALKVQYPIAAAYLTANNVANKSNFEIASIGKKAVERIVNGDDPAHVLAEMNAEISAFATKHMWD